MGWGHEGRALTGLDGYPGQRLGSRYGRDLPLSASASLLLAHTKDGWAGEGAAPTPRAGALEQSLLGYSTLTLGVVPPKQ